MNLASVLPEESTKENDIEEKFYRTMALKKIAAYSLIQCGIDGKLYDKETEVIVNDYIETENAFRKASNEKSLKTTQHILEATPNSWFYMPCPCQPSKARKLNRVADAATIVSKDNIGIIYQRINTSVEMYTKEQLENMLTILREGLQHGGRELFIACTKCDSEEVRIVREFRMKLIAGGMKRG